MIETQGQLSSDEEQQTAPELGKKEMQPADEPYIETAILIGLAIMLLINRFSNSIFNTLLMGIVDAAIAFLLLMALRPRLPYITLTIIAAEMGLLCNTPYIELYNSPWHNLNSFIILLARLIFAGAVGYIFAIWLEVKQNPRAIISLSFLVMFVFTGLQYYYRGLFFL